MSYELGIDFGTTFTAAAVRRAGEPGEPEVIPLGGRGGAVSSVLHLARDERVTVGEAAAGLAGIDPTRVVRALSDASGTRTRSSSAATRGRPRTCRRGCCAGSSTVSPSTRTVRRPGSPWPTRPRGPRTRSSGSPPRSPGRTWCHVRRRAPRGRPAAPPRPRPVTRSASTTSAAAGSMRPSCAGGPAVRRVRDAGRARDDRRPRWPRPRRAGLAARPGRAARRRVTGRAGPARVHPGEGDAQRRGRGRRADPARRLPRRRPAGSRHVRRADRAARGPDGGHPAPHDRVGRTGARAADGAAARRRFGPYPARRADGDRAARLRADRARRSGPRRARRRARARGAGCRGRRRVRAEGERPPRGPSEGRYTRPGARGAVRGAHGGLAVPATMDVPTTPSAHRRSAPRPPRSNRHPPSPHPSPRNRRPGARRAAAAPPPSSTPVLAVPGAAWPGRSSVWER